MPTLTPEQLVAAFLIQTLIYIFFCRALYKALLRVRDSNKTIPAGSVWLLLIPGFAFFWNFRVVASVTSSLHKEFTDRDFDIEEQPGYKLGMIYAVLSIICFLMSLIPSLFIPASILNIVAFVFFVRYWIKINWFRKVLEDDESDSENADS